MSIFSSKNSMRVSTHHFFLLSFINQSNQTTVDQKIRIVDLDIPVNAVATALKDFFSKRLPPLMPNSSMDELSEIANIADAANRLMALRELIRKLPLINFHILKFVFSHFVR